VIDESQKHKYIKTEIREDRGDERDSFEGLPRLRRFPGLPFDRVTGGLKEKEKRKRNVYSTNFSELILLRGKPVEVALDFTLIID